MNTRLRCLELRAVRRKKCEIVFLHTAFDVPLTASVRLLEEEKKVIRISSKALVPSIKHWQQIMKPEHQNIMFW